jgi:hypothetical protein
MSTHVNASKALIKQEAKVCQLGLAQVVERKHCCPPYPSSNTACDMFALSEPIID